MTQNKKRKAGPITKVALGLGIIGGIYAILHLTGVTQIYQIPSSSMEPSYPPGSYIIVSSLGSAEAGDVVSFKNYNDPYAPEGGFTPYCYRLIAKGGDVLEMKEGLAYVNGTLVDHPEAIQQSFFVSGEDKKKYAGRLRKMAKEFRNSGDRAMLTITQSEYEELSETIMLTPHANKLRYPHLPVTAFHQMLDATWTSDDLGPITIPDGQLFFLGDNRDNAEDSRFLGFIPEEDVIGKVLN